MKSVLWRVATAAWICACAAPGGVSARPDPFVIDTVHGLTYQGIDRNEVQAYLGIRYGQDTGGENRFRPPRPFSAGPGSFVNATAVGPGCPQDPKGSAGSVLPGAEYMSEDCLSLNIVRPKWTKTSDRLPVMVWIHGGGLWTGRAHDFYTVPDDLVDQSVKNGLPVIHVAMNYRLGVFGFAQNDALKAEGSVNAGLLDQRLALEWVRDNIEHFGGDPDRVTIFGQSSGGLSVGLHIMAYGGDKPLPFQQAICQSQALEHGLTDSFTINAMRDVVAHLGIRFDLQSPETIAALRQLDTQTLLDASLATHTNIMDGDIWLPVVDGDFLPAAPSELIRTHRFGAATVVIGWCQDDENFLTDFSIRTAEDTRRTIAGFAPQVSPANLDGLLALYPSTEFRPGEALSAEFYRAARIKRDIIMTCQPIHYARQLAAAGNDVYLYDWNQTFLDRLDQALFGIPPGLGVFHLSDVPYVYSNANAWSGLVAGAVNATESDLRLADRASRTFSTFASVGRPGLPGKDTFQGFVPAFGKDNDSINIFVAGGPTEGSSAVDGPGANPALSEQRLRERCEFLNSPEMISQLRY